MCIMYTLKVLAPINREYESILLYICKSIFQVTYTYSAEFLSSQTCTNSLKDSTPCSFR